jgi:ADP-ribosyl-[dinitrogen reductase] hydrolase
MSDLLIDSILGCIVGGAIGDAAGAAFEGTQYPSDLSLMDRPVWRLSDDTQLTLATCEALVDVKNPDPALIAASFLRWFRQRRITGLGSSTLKALRDLEAGAHWALAGRNGDRAAGNGAAMRIAPLAFCVDALTEHSRRLIRDVCRITHHNDEAYVGALALLLAIQNSKESEQALEWVASHLPDTSVRDNLKNYASLDLTLGVAEAGQRFGTSGYVVQSVPFALYAAGRRRELGFKGMLEQVIAAGGDTDTNASLAGQIAGTALGLTGLPRELVEKIPDPEMVMGIAQSFAQRVADCRSTKA